MKKCSRCKQEFEPAPEARGRNRARCKKCNAEAADTYRRQNANTVAATERRRASDPARAAAVAIWSRATKLGAYGLTPEDYERMLVEQNGLCAICNRPETAASTKPRRTGERTVRRLAIDHDHATNRVRGLLCSRCNLAIGMIEDSPDILRAALAYLERF